MTSSAQVPEVMKAESPPAARRGRCSVEELAAKYGIDEAHAGQVAALALTLFDATREWVGAPAEDRGFLAVACRLHNLGHGVNPRQHAQIGQEILWREGLVGYTTAQRRDMAAAIGLHSPRGRSRTVRLPAGQPPESLRALRLAAYLRIADGLDYCHLQDATIVGIQRRNGGVRVIVRSGQFPQNIAVAMRGAALWRDVFSLDLRIILARGKSERAGLLMGRGIDVYEAVRRLLFLHCVGSGTLPVFLVRCRGRRSSSCTSAPTRSNGSWAISATRHWR